MGELEMYLCMHGEGKIHIHGKYLVCQKWCLYFHGIFQFLSRLFWELRLKQTLTIQAWAWTLLQYTISFCFLLCFAWSLVDSLSHGEERWTFV